MMKRLILFLAIFSLFYGFSFGQGQNVPATNIWLTDRILDYNTGDTLIAPYGGSGWYFTNMRRAIDTLDGVPYKQLGFETIAGSNYVYLVTVNDSVGIGTASPVYRLDVTGDARFQEDASVGGIPASYSALSVYQDSAFVSGGGIESSIGQYLQINPTMTLGSSTKIVGYDVVASPKLADTVYAVRSTISTIQGAPSSVAYGIWSDVGYFNKNYSFYGNNGKLYNEDSVGINVKEPLSWFDVDGSIGFPVVTITSDSTIGTTIHTVLIDASGGNVTITLPDATTCNRRLYLIKAIDIANTAKVVSAGGNIDDYVAGTGYTYQYKHEGYIYRSDGTQWWMSSAFNTPGTGGSTTYTISAETNADGADLRLTGSDASTDNVTMKSGTGMTVSRPHADTILFTNTLTQLWSKSALPNEYLYPTTITDSVHAPVFEWTDKSVYNNQNLMIGDTTMGEDITTAYGNVLIGQEVAWDLTAGEENVVIGEGAGKIWTTAWYNTVVGYHASGNANPIGEACFFGWEAGYNDKGLANNAFGFQAMVGTGAANGCCNNAFGLQALYSKSTGFSNQAFGEQALFDLTTGHENVAMGQDAGHHVTTGDYNILIGNGAGNWQTTQDYKLIIASGAYSTKAQSDTSAIITGDMHATDWTQQTITINGNLEVRGSTSGVSGGAPQGSTSGAIEAHTTHTLLDGTMETVLINASGGAVTDTLPDATTVSGRKYIIKATDISNTVKVVSAGGNIDGTAAGTGITYGTQYFSYTYQSDGTQWWIISKF